MDFVQSAILGLVQGLTEFIPVSSTGHLILTRQILGLPLTGSLSFDAILQLATGLAVLVYFGRDIWNIIKERNYKIISILIIGTIPAVIFGFLFEDLMDSKFRSAFIVALSLIAGSILFYFVEKFYRQKTELNYKNGLIIGIFQCLSLVPGFSRSGSTISGGLLIGLSREMAIRFSFLLSLPIIFGSGLKKVFDLWQVGALSQVENSLFIASFFAFISGLLAIHFLLRFLKNHSLNYFGIYRIVLAVVILIFLWK